MRILPTAMLVIGLAAGPAEAGSPAGGAPMASPAGGSWQGAGPAVARDAPGFMRSRRHHAIARGDGWGEGYGFGGGIYGDEAGYGGYIEGRTHAEPATGFFADGETVRVGRRVLYDYDRGYPYRYYREGPRAGLADAPPPGMVRCGYEAGVRVCRR